MQDSKSIENNIESWHISISKCAKQANASEEIITLFLKEAITKTMIIRQGKDKNYFVDISTFEIKILCNNLITTSNFLDLITNRRFLLTFRQEFSRLLMMLKEGVEYPAKKVAINKNEEKVHLEDYDSFDGTDYSDDNESLHQDPHEDFRWGGLSGEEAYIGYWNTE